MLGIVLLYFFISLFATTIGSATGMGGGVIIKPVLDAFRHYDVLTINALSGFTVLVMSIVSVIKQFCNGAKINIKCTLPLAISSALGGFFGGWILDIVIGEERSSNAVFIIQNSILFIFLLFVIIYMKNKDNIKSLNMSGYASSVAVGIILGTISSFLGIGGGPFNIALIIFVFGVCMKEATLMSLICILFAQTAKAGTIIAGGTVSVELKVLLPMIIGAVIGGFAGAAIIKRLENEKIEALFFYAQILVMALCLFNIFRSF